MKTFVGISENALRFQLWTALIALLLLKWLQHRSHDSWSFSNLAAMLHLNLFSYRDLFLWLQQPFGRPTPAAAAVPVQLRFSWPGVGQPENV